jgi:hypothetical protein
LQLSRLIHNTATFQNRLLSGNLQFATIPVF